MRKTENESKNKTEWELRLQQGFSRVWDCGNLKFELKNKKVQS